MRPHDRGPKDRLVCEALRLVTLIRKLAHKQTEAIRAIDVLHKLFNLDEMRGAGGRVDGVSPFTRPTKKLGSPCTLN